MLSIGKVGSSGGAAKYFAADNYYTESQGLGPSEWFGEGAKELGLSNEVSPRMMHELRDLGFTVGRRRTARLMRENGLCAKVKRRFKRTTDSQHEHPVAPNLLDQNFTTERPNQVWSTDISYIWTQEGWRSLSLEPMARCSPSDCNGLIF